MRTFRLPQALGLLLAASSLSGCNNGHSTEVGGKMTFAWQNSPDYTNLYIGNGTEPVIPGGCDSAKWNSRYVLTKGRYWRYADNNAWQFAPAPPDSLVYFVVDKRRYQGRQERDPALHGPLSPQQQQDWEKRITGPYQVPE
ncbi:hypothetical protein [Hymenobacter cellulosivorans]|uniref:Lipoprotein n=1 Tax=Hymenobacter cellulosivorans TaxID=2932249 RepID=A0ABY4FHP3_9BACT|nr:hypothetical protein [Hymenobacter cellulosivorans]UOQ53981.1 hypothetical protein MUN80_04275 [Hymenobacter cellulosivorans]